MSSEVNSAAHYRDDAVKVKTSIADLIVKLWPYFMRQKGLFFATLAAVIVMAVSGRLVPTVFGYTIDKVVTGKREDLLIWCALAYFTLEAVGVLTMFLHSYLFSKLGNRVLYELRDQLIS